MLRATFRLSSCTLRRFSAEAAQPDGSQAQPSTLSADVSPTEKQQILSFLKPLKLEAVASKFSTFDQLVTLRTKELAELGLNIRQRKVLLRHAEFYRAEKRLSERLEQYRQHQHQFLQLIDQQRQQRTAHRQANQHKKLYAQVDVRYPGSANLNARK